LPEYIESCFKCPKLRIALRLKVLNSSAERQLLQTEGALTLKASADNESTDSN